MSKRQKSGLIYIAAAIFLFAASIFTFKSDDIVFVIICAAAGVVFLIAGIMQFKYAKEAALKAQQNKKIPKKASGKKNKK